MNKLPPEVLANICEYLPRRGLKAFRLLLRNTRTAAERFLFRDLYVQFNLRSLERLESVALHPYFGKYVRSIDYDVRRVSPYAVGKGVAYWRRHNALRGMNIGGDGRERFLARLEPAKLEKIYGAYIEYVSGIDYLMRGNHERKMLFEAVSRFPALEGIRCSYPAKMPSMYPVLFKKLSPIAQEILEEPCDMYSPKDRTRSFWTLLDIAFELRFVSQLTDLHISNADLKLWNSFASSKSHDFGTLSALRHLTVGFEENDETQGRGNMSKLKGLIATPSIESLDISFVPYMGDEPLSIARLSHLIDDKQHWPHLTTLSLTGFRTTETALRQLLERHSATLRSLKLSNMAFKLSNIVFAVGNDLPELPSWVKFLKFLNENLELIHVKFDGRLSSDFSESWVTYEYNDDAGYCFGDTPRIPYPDDCLKYRIERFVTHTAEDFPFYPMPEFVKPGILPEECAVADNGWIWKPDRTWRIHDYLL
jgi:hypothetical protein